MAESIVLALTICHCLLFAEAFKRRLHSKWSKTRPTGWSCDCVILMFFIIGKLKLMIGWVLQSGGRLVSLTMGLQNEEANKCGEQILGGLMSKTTTTYLVS